MQIQRPIIKSTTAPDNIEAVWVDVTDAAHPTIKIFGAGGWEKITSDVDVETLKKEIEADVDSIYSPKIDAINTLATDAKGIATAANTSAASASSLAGVAKNLAENAVSVSTSAADTAKTANETATTAKSTADTANSTANTAKSTADTVNTNFNSFKSGDFTTLKNSVSTNTTNITSQGNRITTLETFKTQELSADKFIKTFASESFVAAVTSDGYCIENPDDVKNFSGATVVAILVATPTRKLLIPATSTLKTAYFCNGAQVNTSIIDHQEGASAVTRWQEGYADTKVLASTLKEASWAVNVALKTTLFGQACYLPSLGELNIILQNKDKIEAHTANTTLKFTTVNEIWTSTLNCRVDRADENSYLLTMWGGYWRTQGLDGFNVQGLYTVLPILGLDIANTILYTTGTGDRFLNNAGRYVPINVEETLSYGVSWKPNVADPALTRVGNMSYHKTLPIQSNMKGCIAQMKDRVQIMYYLNPSDWRWRETENARSHVLKSQKLNLGDTYTITNDIFSTLQYEHQWVKINNVACEVTSIDVTTCTATLTPESTLVDGTYDVQLGAVLNGYDGEVMVEVPEFWIKSWDTSIRREVRISPSKIDDTWEHQPKILVAAYYDTCLNSVPENMGYLSTLENNSSLSVCNTNSYCRGGNNNSTYDAYITTDRFRSMLGKPRTDISRATMRANARRSGKEMLSYLQYKRILYWLYFIEYANFNCQATFNAALTSEGYKQGGLGTGLTTMSNWWEYTGNNPICPNGYSNTLGNNTGIKSIDIPAFDYTVYTANVNGYQTNGNVITSTNGSNNSKVITAVKSTSDWALYHNNSTIFGTLTYVISGLTDGQKVIFKENSSYASSTVVKEVTEDGTYEVTWSDYGTNGNKYIGFGSTQDSCNIMIYTTSQNSHVVTKAAQTLSMCRYRGIENPFGNIWHNVDGIIINSSSFTKDGKYYSEVYATEDPSLYSDSDFSKMKMVGIELNEGGWTKEWALGSTAEIIPRLMGGGDTQYKCDNHWANQGTGLRTLFLGADATNGSTSGLGAFASVSGVGDARSLIGSRSSCVIE